MAHGQNLYYVNKKAYYVETNNSIDLAYNQMILKPQIKYCYGILLTN